MLGMNARIFPHDGRIRKAVDNLPVLVYHHSCLSRLLKKVSVLTPYFAFLPRDIFYEVFFTQMPFLPVFVACSYGMS